MFSQFQKGMISILSVAFLLAGCTADEDANMEPEVTVASALSDANSAMGMDGLNSITYSGTAWSIRNSFRQTVSASPPWPSRDTITDYVRTIDLTQPASLATGDTFAQNLFFDPAVAGNYTQDIAADNTNWSQQLEIWLSPWGFLNGAATKGDVEESAQTIDGRDYKVISWMSGENQTSPSGLQYRVTGYINSQNLVERVETWVEDAFMGDMHVMAIYSNYAEHDGVMVPMTMEQQRGGGGVFGVDLTAAGANPGNLVTLMVPPENAGGGGFPGGGAAPTEITQEISEGIYLITGGYVSLAVEFEDHVLVFEGGQSEARGQQIIDEVNKAIPDKPIAYVVNSHPHSDHTAGLIPFVRQGATIITHGNNVEFLQTALRTPRTLLGEETLNPAFAAIGDVGVSEDSNVRLELHHIPNGHTNGMLVGYLPAQGILFQADFTLPQGDAEPNPFVVSLAEYVDENGLEFDAYLAVHAAQEAQTKADLMATIGK